MGEPDQAPSNQGVTIMGMVMMIIESGELLQSPHHPPRGGVDRHKVSRQLFEIWVKYAAYTSHDKETSVASGFSPIFQRAARWLAFAGYPCKATPWAEEQVTSEEHASKPHPSNPCRNALHVKSLVTSHSFSRANITTRMTATALTQDMHIDFAIPGELMWCTHA